MSNLKALWKEFVESKLETVDEFPLTKEGIDQFEELMHRVHFGNEFNLMQASFALFKANTVTITLTKDEAAFVLSELKCATEIGLDVMLYADTQEDKKEAKSRVDQSLALYNTLHALTK